MTDKIVCDHYEATLEALNAAQYYIGQLERVVSGKMVRDLGEAESHFILANTKARAIISQATK